MTRAAMVRALHAAGLPAGGTGLEYRDDGFVRRLWEAALTPAERAGQEREERTRAALAEVAGLEAELERGRADDGR